ncbi:MAG: GlsB/YeaQ/YmgE family stress response membrane protein [Planctomyces sp.]|nr:GlsB/YeaQ/YmgE family stress response membrane protein [Planctomyces sp.]
MELLGAILGWCLFGVLAGGLARLLVPGPQPMGCLGTILLGVAGSFTGGFAVWLLSGGSPLQPSGFIASLLGAIVILVLANRNRRRRI